MFCFLMGHDDESTQKVPLCDLENFPGFNKFVVCIPCHSCLPQTWLSVFLLH